MWKPTSGPDWADCTAQGVVNWAYHFITTLLAGKGRPASVTLLSHSPSFFLSVPFRVFKMTKWGFLVQKFQIPSSRLGRAGFDRADNPGAKNLYVTSTRGHGASWEHTSYCCWAWGSEEGQTGVKKKKYILREWMRGAPTASPCFCRGPEFGCQHRHEVAPDSL